MEDCRLLWKYWVDFPPQNELYRATLNVKKKKSKRNEPGTPLG